MIKDTRYLYNVVSIESNMYIIDKIYIYIYIYIYININIIDIDIDIYIYIYMST